jgi:hypothetical protein
MMTTYRTTPNRCVDCGEVVSEGPRCVSCTRYFQEVTPDETCENCERVLVGSELRWAEDNDSPFCRACAEGQAVAAGA